MKKISKKLLLVLLSMLIFSEKEIATEWIENFLNENLIVIEIKSR